MSDSTAQFIFEVRVWRLLIHAGDYCCYDDFTVFVDNVLQHSDHRVPRSNLAGHNTISSPLIVFMSTKRAENSSKQNI